MYSLIISNNTAATCTVAGTFVSEDLKVSPFNHIVISSSNPLFQYFMFPAGQNVMGCLALRTDHLLKGPVLAFMDCSSTNPFLALLSLLALSCRASKGNIPWTKSHLPFNLGLDFGVFFPYDQCLCRTEPLCPCPFRMRWWHTPSCSPNGCLPGSHSSIRGNLQGASRVCSVIGPVPRNHLPSIGNLKLI